MDSKLFETIYGNLEKRVNWCDENIKPLREGDTLQNLSVKQFNTLITNASNYMSEMDKIYAEVNHIYGMGNLTVCQQSQLMSMMKRFSYYRSDLKYLSSYNNFKVEPKLPDKSEYKLSVLADVTFKRVGEKCSAKLGKVVEKKKEEEVEVEVEDLDSLKQTLNNAINNIQPYNIVHEADNVDMLEVRFNIDDLQTIDQVNKDISTLLNESRPKRKKFLKQVCKLGEHYKFKWDVEGPGKLVGRIQLTNKIWLRAKALAGIH